MTTDSISGLDTMPTDITGGPDVNDNGKLDKAKTLATSAGSTAKSFATTVAGKAKDVATSDTVTKAKDAVVTTVKDPEKREQAVAVTKKHRNKGLVVAGLAAVFLVVRKLRKPKG